MLSTLETGTNVCRDVPELWYYRLIVDERLGKPEKELRYVHTQLDKLSFEATYNPFTPPPAAAPPPAQLPPSQVRKKWALVVGIDQFRDPNIHSLHYAVKDSNDFTAFLTDPQGGRFQPDRVRHLVNEQATLGGIREGLGWLRQNVQPDDLVVVYFSSHGTPRDIDPNGVSYVLTHDTSLDDAAKLYATSLQMIDLVQSLNREIKARRVVLFLDTCYSGDASGARGVVRPVWSQAAPAAESPASSAFSAALTTIKLGQGRAVITASRANEQSWESDTLKNGYFTHFLISALSENHAAPTLGAIFTELRDQVSAGVKMQYGQTQTPSSEFSDQADAIAIGVPETI
jgi:uncharacterized caspase-like protein